MSNPTEPSDQNGEVSSAPTAEPGDASTTVVDEPSPGSDVPSTQRSGSTFRWQDHVALAVTGGVGLVAALKLLRAAHAKPETVYALLTYSGTGNAVTSVVLEAVPELLAVAYVIVILRYRRMRLKPSVGLTLALALSIYIVPWPFLLLAVAFVVIDWVIEFVIGWPSRKKPKKEKHWDMSDIVSSYGFFILLAVFGGDRVWLPAEAIQVGHDKPITGYVLSSEPTDLVVLRDYDRAVVRIDRTKLTSRTFCATRSNGWPWDHTSLISQGLDGRSPQYPACPRP